MSDWYIITSLFGCLLIALLIEYVFRTIDRFPAYTRNFFRWVYIGLLAFLVVFFVMLQLRNYDKMFRYIIENEVWELVMIGLLFISSLLINKKKKLVE